MDLCVQEKNRCLGFMFRKGSGLRQDPIVVHAFAATNRGLYTTTDSLDDLLDWSPEELITHLNTWSRRHLADPQAAEAVRVAIQDSYPVPDALVGPLNTCLTTSWTLLDALAQQIRALDAEIAEALRAFPEAAWLRALPGLGPIFTAGLLAEIAGIARFADHPPPWPIRTSTVPTRGGFPPARVTYATTWWKARTRRGCTPRNSRPTTSGSVPSAPMTRTSALCCSPPGNWCGFSSTVSRTKRRTSRRARGRRDASRRRPARGPGPIQHACHGRTCCSRTSTHLVPHRKNTLLPLDIVS